jgi:WD40 repeat protein
MPDRLESFITKSWEVMRKITGQPETINAISFSPDGTMLVSGGTFAVRVVAEDFLAAIPAIADVVDGTGIFEVQLTRA